MEELEKLRYPIGKFIAPETYTNEYLSEKIESIATFPQLLKEEVIHLNKEQLETPYRPDGWTIRQVIHHCADSHLNCYVRIKWALTEDNPIIKYYHEDKWGNIYDNVNMPIEPTLLLLEGLHFRLAYLMKNLSKDDLNKSFIHPEHDSVIQLKEIIGMYSWHWNHHLAHITELKIRKSW